MSAWGTRGWQRSRQLVGGAFLLSSMPKGFLHKPHVVLRAGTLTDCHMAGHCQLNDHQHLFCLPIVNLSFLMATVGQMLTEYSRTQAAAEALYLSLRGKSLLCLCGWILYRLFQGKELNVYSASGVFCVHMIVCVSIQYVHGACVFV